VEKNEGKSERKFNRYHLKIGWDVFAYMTTRLGSSEEGHSSDYTGET
jgi:hypothetical protein